MYVYTQVFNSKLTSSSAANTSRARNYHDKDDLEFEVQHFAVTISPVREAPSDVTDSSEHNG